MRRSGAHKTENNRAPHRPSAPPPHRSVIVIGGGFAGLSAATALAERGIVVTVLEGRQVLGGRAYSFKDPQTGDSVDNGQHLFMGCYRETIAFLERIGTSARLKFQRDLSVRFAGDRGRRAMLRCWPLPAPLHLVSGLLRLQTLPWLDRLRLIKVDQALRRVRARPGSLSHVTVRQWLNSCGQSETAQRHFWDLIAIATLNEDPAIACAEPFAAVLAQAFFDARESSRLGIASVGLSDLYAKEAARYIEERGGSVLLKSPVAKIETARGRAVAVRLREGTGLEADWILSAVAPTAFLKLLPDGLIESHPELQRIAQLQFAPIISIHLWFDRAIIGCKFAGLLDTHVQWAFDKSRILKDVQTRDGYLSLVISGAHAFTDWTEKRIVTLALEELRRIFPEARDAALARSLVIKEHQATLSPTVGSEILRPGPVSPLPNFLVAGDWTRTGLPATIESACMSGHACATIILSSLSAARKPEEARHVAR